ncbi:hypothetical protein D3871_11045 [Noviherbaspirillum saxi]|uniref:Zinc ribbon domain-containing protein n=1 Tax=Noviherbaspirillum saxi TaxID=2320863 RepID=A0A3A3FS01_9BURK|nr:hypothetical protein D3871_11045 [Noviherbaspirillum saxi]
MRLMSCLQCQCRLSDQAKSCPDCGYPVPGENSSKISDTDAISEHPLQQYRTLRIIGLAAMGSTVVIAMNEFHTAATIAGISGATTYLIGLLSAWWNT